MDGGDTAGTWAFSEEDLVALAEGASTPEERLSARFEALRDEAAVEVRLRRWSELAAKGNDGAFRRTLAWRGIDLQTFRHGLGPVRLAPGAPLPRWTLRFREIIERVGGQAGTATTASLSIAAVVDASINDIKQAAVPAGVAAEAVAALGSILAERLARLCEGGLRADAAFSPELAAAIGFGRIPAGVADGPGGARGFFRRYPVLARLSVTLIDGWRDMATEFLHRLRADRALIAAAFFGGRDPGPLTAIAAENADPHDGGRIVMLLTFASGDRLVYKPRSLDLDAALEGLVVWLGRKIPGSMLRVPHVVDRGDYGWSEFIAYAPPPDGGLAEFYRGAGHLLALAYALDAGDLHYENVIANGPHLVPVDVETILQPRVAPARSGASRDAARSLLRPLMQSVTLTGLLPAWARLNATMFFDIGGLGDPALPGTANLHRPSARRIEEVLAEHGPMLLQGFAEYYRGLLDVRDALLAADGPLAAMDGTSVRYLFRDTRTYGQIIGLATAGEAAADGADHAIAIERLARALCLYESPPVHLPLFASEMRSIVSMDIPRFRTLANARDILDRYGIVAAEAFERSATDRARERITSLTPEDLGQQRRTAALLLQARIADAGTFGEAAHGAAAVTAAEDPVGLAGYLGEAIAGSAIERHDGAPAWFDLGRETVDAPCTVSLGDVSFAYGAGGIALFYAGLARIAGSGEAGNRMAAILPALQETVNWSPDPGFYRSIKQQIGGANGLGGLVYLLTLMGRITAREDLCELALAAAMQVSDEAIAGETMLDLHSGLAGAIIGLASLQMSHPDTRVAGRLAALGRRLEEMASEENLARTAGFGLFGSAGGAALAASRLDRLMPDPAWRLIADRARRLMQPAAGARGWATGEVGLYLLQQALSDRGWCASPEIVVGDHPSSGDGLASGAWAEADMLCELGRRLGRVDLTERGEELAARLRSRAARGLHFFPLQLYEGIPANLMLGRAGLGYQSLRLARPEAIPFLLLFE